MPDTPDHPDFITRATQQLREAEIGGPDTIVLATMNGERLVMQTRTPRGPRELVHIARRLLEEALDQFDDPASACAPADEDDEAYYASCIANALDELPDPDDPAAEAGG